MAKPRHSLLGASTDPIGAMEVVFRVQEEAVIGTIIMGEVLQDI
jgi:hypothetical protein